MRIKLGTSKQWVAGVCTLAVVFFWLTGAIGGGCAFGPASIHCTFVFKAPPLENPFVPAEEDARSKSF
jgi:hypothetical protein